MELKWLEDFVALNENGSFSKAAKTRYVTQPAFSRRIRALENWLGVSLIDRDIYPTNFTDAGEKFLIFAQQSVAETYGIREALRSDVDQENNLTIKAQHSLTVSFLPSWLQTLEPLTSHRLLKVHATDLHDAVDAFIAGTGDFLLCYSSKDGIEGLARDDIESIQVGTDFLVPVSATDKDGNAIHQFRQGQPLRLLSYPPKSFFGRLMRYECIPKLGLDNVIQYVYENALAEALKALALKGYGVTWLPKNLITDELANNKLKILPAPLQSVTLSIQFYRFRQYQSESSEKFWGYLEELYQ